MSPCPKPLGGSAKTVAVEDSGELVLAGRYSGSVAVGRLGFPRLRDAVRLSRPR